MTDHRVVALEKDSWLKVNDPGAPGVIASYLCPK